MQFASDTPRRRDLALVMKGGGVKGLALAGAISELEPYFRFTTLVGTSAGSIAAVFLAAGMTSRDIIHLLGATPLGALLGDSKFRQLRLLLTRGGLHGGERLQKWISETLRHFLGSSTEVRLKDLTHRAVIFASAPDRGLVVFDSLGTNAEVDAAFATRCSSAIPVFFVRPEHHGYQISDGGLLANFPLEEYSRMWEREAKSQGAPPFLALYLGKVRERMPSNPSAGLWSVVRDTLRILLERNESVVVAEGYREQTIVIDTFPIRSTDFRLSEASKSLLVERGRAAALSHLLSQRVIPESSLEEARGRLAACTAAIERAALVVKKEHRWRSVRRASYTLAAIALLSGAKPLYQKVTADPPPRFSMTNLLVYDEGMEYENGRSSFGGHYVLSRLDSGGEARCRLSAKIPSRDTLVVTNDDGELRVLSEEEADLTAQPASHYVVFRQDEDQEPKVARLFDRGPAVTTVKYILQLADDNWDQIDFYVMCHDNRGWETEMGGPLSLVRGGRADGIRISEPFIHAATFERRLANISGLFLLSKPNTAPLNDECRVAAAIPDRVPAREFGRRLATSVTGTPQGTAAELALGDVSSAHSRGSGVPDLSVEAWVFDSVFFDMRIRAHLWQAFQIRIECGPVFSNWLLVKRPTEER